MEFTQVICFLVSVAVSYGQFFFSNNFQCSSILSQDCYKWGEHPECGTNGITYRNRCDYSKAHCDNNNIHVDYHGACRAAVSTTPNPGQGPILTGPDAIFDFFCLELSHMACTADKETICGSDGNTYVNTCEFEKQRCTHREMTVAKFGTC